MTQDSTDKFPKETNKWIEEDIEVPTISPVEDKDGNIHFEKTTKVMKQRTFYADSKPTRMVCANHEYLPMDKGRYLFKCVHCDWHRIAPPVTFRYDAQTRILSYRKTGIRV